MQLAAYSHIHHGFVEWIESITKYAGWYLRAQSTSRWLIISYYHHPIPTGMVPGTRQVRECERTKCHFHQLQCRIVFLVQLAVGAALTVYSTRITTSHVGNYACRIAYLASYTISIADHHHSHSKRKHNMKRLEKDRNTGSKLRGWSLISTIWHVECVSHGTFVIISFELTPATAACRLLPAAAATIIWNYQVCWQQQLDNRTPLKTYQCHALQSNFNYCATYVAYSHP